MNAWRSVLLSTPVMFRILDAGEDSLYWKAYQQRQRLVAGNDATQRTVRQWAHELSALKGRKEETDGEEMSVQKFQTFWMEKAQDGAAKTTKRLFSATFVRDVLQIHRDLLLDAYCNSKLDILEEIYGLESCFNNKDNLLSICQKSDGLAGRQWVLGWIADAISSGGLPNDKAS